MVLLKLDESWNEAYRRHDRTPLHHILADDFAGLTPSGRPFTKADLIVDPPERAVAVDFSEQHICAFGDTGVATGRVEIEFADRRVDQRFLRVYARRKGAWRAVSVAVIPPQSS
jgi:hypothetical protein